MRPAGDFQLIGSSLAESVADHWALHVERHAAVTPLAAGAATSMQLTVVFRSSSNPSAPIPVVFEHELEAEGRQAGPEAIRDTSVR